MPYVHPFQLLQQDCFIISCRSRISPMRRFCLMLPCCQSCPFSILLRCFKHGRLKCCRLPGREAGFAAIPQSCSSPSFVQLCRAFCYTSSPIAAIVAAFLDRPTFSCHFPNRTTGQNLLQISVAILDKRNTSCRFNLKG